jgi:predicted dehydrogenase
MAITVGVIGCGNISRFHFQGLAQAQVRIAWVCDLNPVASAPYAAQHGARVTADWREVIADPAVDAVVITTISRVHKPICLAAIAAGKAVICEKTLAENPDDALAIVQAAESAGTLFWTSYMKRFIPAVAKAKELLPALGRIQSTHIRAYQCWGDLWGAMPSEGFFHTPAGGASPIVRNYGGGILVCGSSHILDLVNFFHGRPHRLYASLCEPEGRDYDLQAAALLETANGPVHYEALAHSLPHSGFLRDGWDEQIEIIGSRGKIQIFSAKWDEPELKSSLLIHEDAASGTRTEHRFPCISPFTLALQHFCTCIAAGEQGPQARTTGYDVDELIAHIQRSGREGRSLTVEYRC